MSAYSDYKYGLLTEAEYNGICKREALEEAERLRREAAGYTDENEEEYFYDDEIDEF